MASVCAHGGAQARMISTSKAKWRRTSGERITDGKKAGRFLGETKGAPKQGGVVGEGKGSTSPNPNATAAPLSLVCRAFPVAVMVAAEPDADAATPSAIISQNC